MKKLLLIVLPLLLVVGCSKEPINIDKLTDVDGIYYDTDTGERYSGQVFGLDMGKDEGTLKNGRKDGLWVIYNQNGKKKYERTYKDGKLDGLWTNWYDNGQKRSETTFKNGKEEGLVTWWYENGQKWSETTYKNGKKISSKQWNEDGSVEGIPYITYYDNGQLSEKGILKNDKLDGLWTNWYKNGQKMMETTWKDGIPIGLGTGWYENGQKEWEQTYKNRRVISSKCWDEDGNECDECSEDIGVGCK